MPSRQLSILVTLTMYKKFTTVNSQTLLSTQSHCSHRKVNLLGPLNDYDVLNNANRRPTVQFIKKKREMRNTEKKTTAKQ